MQYYSGNNQNHKLEHSHFFSNTTKVLEKDDCWSNISSLWRHTHMHIHMVLLAPIDSSLSSERRLWAEDAKMSVEFPITINDNRQWQSRQWRDNHVGLQRYKMYCISSYPANVCGYPFVCQTYRRYHLTMFSFHPVGGTVLHFLVLLIFLVLM